MTPAEALDAQRARSTTQTVEIDALLAALEAARAAGAAWLELTIGNCSIVVVWPSAEPLLAPDASLVDEGHASRPPTAAQVAQGAREPLPWDHYAPELRTELKDLATRYRPDAVADAAGRLAELIALHGPPRPRPPAAAGGAQ